MRRVFSLLERIVPTAVLLAAMATSVSMVLVRPDLYYSYDVKEITSWGEKLAANWRDIYLTCDSCTYPIVGTLLSGGLIHLLGSTDPAAAPLRFRLLTGVIDAANVLLLYLLMKQLGIRRSALWAGIVGLLPSSWVGGALWGQIDSYSQFSLLLALLLIALFNRAMQREERRRLLAAYLLLAGLPIACLMLTKQLSVFSVLVLEGVMLANLCFVSRSVPKAILYFGMFVAWQAALVLLPDLFLRVEDGYVSHLAYVWLTRSDHLNEVSRSGFSIWVYLGWERTASSQTPFYLGLTPKGTGLGLFGGWMAVLSASLAMRLRRLYRASRIRAFDGETLADLVFFLALTNLCFNVFLSGMHERYLYHFYPFVIAGFLGLRRHSALFAGATLAVLLFGGVSYGAFVLEKLSSGLPMALFLLKDARFQAALHLFLLVYLSLLYLRYHGSPSWLRRWLAGRAEGVATG